MEACGVNHFDVDLRAGVSRWPLPLPHQLGVEFAGTVDAVGDGRRAPRARATRLAAARGGVRRLPVLPRRASPTCAWTRRMFSVQYPGGYAEYVVAPASATHLLPDGVTFEQAAAGQVVFTTAWHMLVTRARLSARPRPSSCRPRAAASATPRSRSRRSTARA